MWLIVARLSHYAFEDCAEARLEVLEEEGRDCAIREVDDESAVRHADLYSCALIRGGREGYARPQHVRRQPQRKPGQRTMFEFVRVAS